MKVEKMEVLAIAVPNLERTVALCSKLFGIDIEIQAFPDDSVIDPVFIPANSGWDKRSRLAIDKTGFFELVDLKGGAAGVRNVHLKVADLDSAKLEMADAGARLLLEVKIRNLREAVYELDDFPGLKFVLVEYDAPTLEEAMRG